MKNVKINGKEVTLTSSVQEIAYRDVDENTTCSYCYGEIEEGDELTTRAILNPENSQKKMVDGVISHVVCADDSDVEEAMSQSSRYTDYHNTITDRMYDVVSDPERDEEEKEEAKKEYRAAVSKLSSSYRDLADEAEEEIKKAMNV